MPILLRILKSRMPCRKTAVWVVLLLLLTQTVAYALSEDEENTISVYERVNASVVNITNIAVTYDFFLNPIPSQASGSGSIISKEGHILTNHHVVKDSDRLIVTLSDGSKWQAELIGSDPITDLAVIQIKAPANRLTVIPIGRSDRLRIGQKVMAIGNPFGLERTLTTGIISAIRKRIKMDDFEIEGVIQVDASINPGNSGGPLIDSNGKMIGVNTAIFTPSGGSVGIGFAVPVDTVKKNLNELITKGYVAYAWLGVETQTLTKEIAEILDLPVDHGAMVARLARGGPAHRGGIKGGTRRVEIGNAIMIIGGDIIVAVDGKTFETAQAFHEIMKAQKPGDRVSLTLWREGKKRRILVELGERPRPRRR
ncbi:MAG: S1C family serine protease [Nitrospiria bacterium]